VTCGRRPRAAPVYSMEFESYAEVPKAVADEIVQKNKGE
jgi:elongation factor G